MSLLFLKRRVSFATPGILHSLLGVILLFVHLKHRLIKFAGIRYSLSYFYGLIKCLDIKTYLTEKAYYQLIASAYIMN